LTSGQTNARRISEAPNTAHPGLRSIRLNGEGQKRPPKPARFRGEIDPLHVPDRNQADRLARRLSGQDPGGAPGHLGTSSLRTQRSP